MTNLITVSDIPILYKHLKDISNSFYLAIGGTSGVIVGMNMNMDTINIIIIFLTGFIGASGAAVAKALWPIIIKHLYERYEIRRAQKEEEEEIQELLNNQNSESYETNLDGETKGSPK